MHDDYFHLTTIGPDYLKSNSEYPIDSLLDYLSGLKKLRLEVEHNEMWKTKFNNEIRAVKEILRIQTSSTVSDFVT